MPPSNPSSIADRVTVLGGLLGTGVVWALITASAAADVVGPPVSADPAVSSKSTESTGTPQLQQVVVTARKFSENIQNVPDSIIAFTPTTIVNSGIQTVEDVAALTPSLNFESGCAFECGVAFMSMRGVGNGQQGWPSISFIVDGVPAASLTEIDSGSLVDIERIEVLRGPESALYGFNAIAGAINIITKPPTDHWESNARLLYGNGDDRQVGGDVSGPLIPDKLLFSLNAAYRDDLGLIRSASNGIPLDFKDWKQAGLRMLFTPSSNLRIDLHGNIDREHDGAVYEEKVPSEADASDFSAPYTDPRRAFPGVQDRSIDHWAARVEWDFDSMSLISVSDFTHTDESVPTSSLCYDDPNDPLVPAAAGGGIGCLLGTAYGRAAAPGEPIDDYYSDLNYYRTVFQDLRLASSSSGPLEWTAGVSALYRRTLEGFDAGVILAPVSPYEYLGPTYEDLLPDWHRNYDNWWGGYGQLIWNITSRLQVTVAGRYDEERYSSTAYTSRSTTTMIPFETAAGLEDSQHHNGSAFQPKGSVSYHFTPDLMGYATVSRGFRAGYYFNGDYTLPEETTNYEFGVKSTIADRIRLNADIFRVLYYHQQFSEIISTYPFQISTSIPLTRINGVELDPTLLLSRYVSLGLGLSYINAEVSDGTASPNTPKLQASPTLDVTYPVTDEWNMLLHVDDRYNSYEYLTTDDGQYQGAVNLLNARLGVQNDRYSITTFVRNAADRRYQTQAGAVLGSGFIRYENDPRTYGVEVRAHFF